jgi:hypothetical protein
MIDPYLPILQKYLIGLFLVNIKQTKSSSEKKGLLFNGMKDSWNKQPKGLPGPMQNYKTKGRFLL